VWVLLGAPFDSSGTGRGEERAPDALRAAGLPASVADFNPDLDEDGAHARPVVDALASALHVHN